MTFPLQQGVVVGSSKITKAPLSSIYPFTHTLGTCGLIVSSFALFTVYPNCIMRRHPIPLQVISHEIAGGRSERTQEPSKNGGLKLNHLYMKQGPPLHPIFRALACSLHHHSAAQGHIHIIPSSHTPVPSVPVLD